MNALIACMNALTACMNVLIACMSVDSLHERVACREDALTSYHRVMQNFVRRIFRNSSNITACDRTPVEKKSETFVKMGPVGYTVERQRSVRATGK